MCVCLHFGVLDMPKYNQSSCSRRCGVSKIAAVGFAPWRRSCNSKLTGLLDSAKGPHYLILLLESFASVVYPDVHAGRSC